MKKMNRNTNSNKKTLNFTLNNLNKNYYIEVAK